MCAFGLYIDHVDGLAGSNVKLVTLDSAKAEV